MRTDEKGESMKKLVVVLVLAVTALRAIAGVPAAAALPLTSVPERSHVCMMQDTVLPTAGLPVEHNGKTYFGCCPMCRGRMLAEPTKYTLATDPVSGKQVDKATAPLLEYRGKVFYFESEKTRDAFARDPGRGASR
jgi:YHS domain-containing protein